MLAHSRMVSGYAMMSGRWICSFKFPQNTRECMKITPQSESTWKVQKVILNDFDGNPKVYQGFPAPLLPPVGPDGLGVTKADRGKVSDRFWLVLA